jgi:hypothetical protein
MTTNLITSCLCLSNISLLLQKKRGGTSHDEEEEEDEDDHDRKKPAVARSLFASQDDPAAIPEPCATFFLKRFLIFESKSKDQILDKDNYYSGGQIKHARDVREGLDFEESHDDHFKYPAAIVLQSFDQAISLASIKPSRFFVTT